MTEATFSIIVETENLGTAGLDDLRATLDSLAAQTHPVSAAREVLLVVGGYVPAAVQVELAAAYPFARVLNAGRQLEYTLAKRLGAEAASGDILVFADSDVRYAPTWLAALLGCFAMDSEADIVCGDTQSRNGSIYATAMNIMWIFRIQRRIAEATRQSYFQLSNFAVRRRLLLDAPFEPDMPLYRGYRITRFKRDLLARARRSYRVPGAQALHLPPQGLADWWYRLLIQGSDAVVYAAKFQGRGLPGRLWHGVHFVGGRFAIGWRNAVNLVRNDRRNLPHVLASVPLCLACGGVMWLGALIAAFRPYYLLRRIEARAAAGKA